MRFPKNVVLLCSYVLTSFVMWSLFTACEPTAHFQIRNDTNEVLTIFISRTYLEHIGAADVRVKEGFVGPGKTLRPEGIPAMFSTYLVEARDASGNVVYSKEFTVDELRKANWKVIISLE